MNDSRPQFLLPLGTKKLKTLQSYETKIHIDNSRGGEDLIELSIHYAQYGTYATKTKLLSNKVKVGKTADFVLPAGTHPTAFLLLWKASSFFRWFGETTIGSYITTEIDANWRVDVVDGISVWGGGYSSSGSQP